MKLRPLSRSVLAAALAVIGWMPLDGAAQDASLATYRCVVQGDTSQCRPLASTPEVHIQKQLVLGPYALYLAHHGQSTAAAATKAQAIGEYAVERTVRITRRNLSHLEKYERSRGGLPTFDTIDEMLAEVRLDARDQRIAALLRGY